MVVVMVVVMDLATIPEGLIIREIIIVPISLGYIPILLIAALSIVVTERVIGPHTPLTNTITKSWTETGLV